MDIIKTIRAEIERRITDNTFGAKLELMDILAWLDTIESGSSEIPNDLEEAARQHAHFPFTDEEGNFHEDAIDASAYWDFIAGAKWQAEQLLKSSPLPEDTVLFNKGVAAGKRLMIEDAVEGIVQISYTDETALIICPYSGTSGDKVRIIILKED